MLSAFCGTVSSATAETVDTGNLESTRRLETAPFKAAFSLPVLCSGREVETDCPSRFCNEIEIKMKINSIRHFGPDRDRFSCTVDGKTLTVVLRNAALFPNALGIDDIDMDRGIHVAFVDKPRKAEKQIAEPFSEAKAGDLVVLLYPGAESRKAILAVLGLDDAGTVFDRR